MEESNMHGWLTTIIILIECHHTCNAPCHTLGTYLLWASFLFFRPSEFMAKWLVLLTVRLKSQAERFM